MERITYQRTLDVHKSGVQFTLQGVETGDNLSRVIEISLMASGDAIDFPLDHIVPVMYVKTPFSFEPSIVECAIKDNVVVYEVLPIAEEGITEMQLKLIETSPEGATRVLVAPRFAIEVTKSSVADDSEVQKTSFSALENAIARAKEAHERSIKNIELDSDCMFRVKYENGDKYETDILKRLFYNGNVILSESWAKGDTGVRAGEDTNNSKYYSEVSKSEALNAKAIMENSEELLEESRLHGVYTAFSVDFETGEAMYVSPSYKFSVNTETGDLEAIGKAYTFEGDVGRVVDEWLNSYGADITSLKTTTDTNTKDIGELNKTTYELKTQVLPVEKGGTGSTSIAEMLRKFGINSEEKPWNTENNVGLISDKTSFSLNRGNSTSYKKAFSIVAINSGEVYVCFEDGSGRGSSYKVGNAQAKIYVNDELRETVNIAASGKYETKISSINNRDVITVLFEALPASGSAFLFAIDNICLKANIETPYRYLVLADALKNRSGNITPEQYKELFGEEL